MKESSSLFWKEKKNIILNVNFNNIQFIYDEFYSLLIVKIYRNIKTYKIVYI